MRITIEDRYRRNRYMTSYTTLQLQRYKRESETFKCYKFISLYCIIC